MSDVPPDPRLNPEPQTPEVPAPRTAEGQRTDRVVFKAPWGHPPASATTLRVPAAVPQPRVATPEWPTNPDHAAPDEVTLVADLRVIPTPQQVPTGYLTVPPPPTVPPPAAPRPSTFQSPSIEPSRIEPTSIEPSRMTPTAPAEETAVTALSASDTVPADSGNPAQHVSPITPAQGGWAAIILLIIQNVVGGLAQYWHIPLGWPLLLAFVLTILGFFALLPYPMRLLQGDSRFTTRPRLGLVLGASVLAFIASRGLLLFGASVWPAALNATQPLLSSGGQFIPLLLAVGIGIPIAEEIAFRGLLLRGLERARGPVVAAGLSSLLFALAHGSPLQILAIFPLAWSMARAVQYSGSLWSSVGMHILNNSLTVIFYFALQSKAANWPVVGFETATANRVPLTLGLAGLLVGLTALAVVTVWLKPRFAAQPAENPPRVWTISTIMLLLLAVAGVVFTVWQLLRPVQPNF